MKDSKEGKILSIIQLPPPVHGQSVMNKFVNKSNLLNSSFKIKTISFHFTDLKNMGKPSILKLIKMVKYFFKILKELIIFKPNLVYFTLSPIGFAFYRDVIYVLLLKIFRANILYHLHGKGINNAAKKPINRIIYKFIFKNTNVICLSEHLVRDISDVFKGKAFIVNNGIEPVKNIKETKSDKKKLQIIYLSNFTKTKGIYNFLEALKIVDRKNIDFEAKTIGKPFNVTEKDINDYLVQNNLSDKITNVGPKYGEEKIQILQNTDIFVFPTHYKNEAFPLVILEAMQFGIPIITTNEGGIPDIIDDSKTGYITNPHDFNEIANKIITLIKDKELRESMGKAAREKFQKKYMIQKFEKNLCHVFKEVLK